MVYSAGRSLVLQSAKDARQRFPGAHANLVSSLALCLGHCGAPSFVVSASGPAPSVHERSSAGGDARARGSAGVQVTSSLAVWTLGGAHGLTHLVDLHEHDSAGVQVASARQIL